MARTRMEAVVERQCYSIDETGEILGLSRSTVYRLLDTGQIEFHRMGARRRIHRNAIDAYLESTRCGGSEVA